MTISILPTRRDIKFNLPAEKATSWHKTGMHVSQFFNTMSLFFPVGERFFIDAVRAHRDQVTDPELKKAVTAFIGQEAMHGREHEELNELLENAGVPAVAQEKFVYALLKQVEKYSPKIFPLVATVALEHLTAILADSLLRNPETVEGSDERFVALWNWHALEETEHKAVAFDVYATVMANKPIRAYFLRTFGLVAATTIFLAIMYPYYIENVRRQGGLFNVKGWITSFQYQWGNPGTLRQAVKPWLDWFKPGFHPWDHDNRHFLDQIDQFLEVVTETKDAA
ncbi:MAG: metal-dependent hydrolase [Alcanivoracaceae bacterium]|nr:metal-dependent hydrolase [Alcanivoracaceae bacterium]